MFFNSLLFSPTFPRMMPSRRKLKCNIACSDTFVCCSLNELFPFSCSSLLSHPLHFWLQSPGLSFLTSCPGLLHKKWGPFFGSPSFSQSTLQYGLRQTAHTQINRFPITGIQNGGIRHKAAHPHAHTHRILFYWCCLQIHYYFSFVWCFELYSYFPTVSIGYDNFFSALRFS